MSSRYLKNSKSVCGGDWCAHIDGSGPLVLCSRLLVTVVTTLDPEVVVVIVVVTVGMEMFGTKYSAPALFVTPASSAPEGPLLPRRLTRLTLRGVCR